MTTSGAPVEQAPTASPSERAPGNRRRVLGAVLAALLVGATMAALAVLGESVRDPHLRTSERLDLPLLADEPLPGASGTVAAIGGGGVRCVTLIDVATGSDRDLRCERDLVHERPRWTADGALEIVRHDPAGPEVLVLAVEDGTVRDRRLVTHDAIRDEPQRHLAADGRRLVVGADEERTWLEVVTPAGGTDRIVTLPSSSWAGFSSAAWSPDERFALVEGHGAVYVVALATGEARVLADGVRNAAWGPSSTADAADGG
jgi:hypothetical protein